MRTALLRSLSRGKAHILQHAQSKQPKPVNAGTIITYPSCTGGSSVTHISATFPLISHGLKRIQNGQGLASLRPHLMHGSSDTGTVTSSDPTTGRVDRKTVVGTPLQPRQLISWPIHGLADHRPGIELGSSLMDMSDELGWCVGETVPGGRVYVEPKALATAPTRGYFLSSKEHIFAAEGRAYISSLWIAKRKYTGIFEYTGGRCGLLVGESTGRLTMYSLPTTLKEWDTPRSWIDAIQSWLICPGVPILGIKVDEEYSAKRQRRYRRTNKGMVITVVNALGEVYYLRDFAAGSWRLIEQTRRLVDYISEEDKMQLETELWMVNLQWERVQRLWKGWGMDYFVEVDFAGQIVVLGKKRSSDQSFVTAEMDPLLGGGGWVKCFHLENNGRNNVGNDRSGLLMGVPLPHCKTESRPTERSIFHYSVDESTSQSPSKELEGVEISEVHGPQSEITEREATLENLCIRDEWVFKNLSFSHERHSHKALEITAFAIDKSYIALLAPDEDSFDRNEYEIPGLNARLFAVGTCTGSVFVWNVRSSPKKEGAEEPIRIIHTDSPIITTVGITSLYLIHGGSDGLVQCWDPLASRVDPIRTIHSRFSSRARRRATQAEIIRPTLGLDDNEHAARVVQLDPDPTVLRGAIALGTHIRYWSFVGGLSLAALGKRRTNRVGGPPGRNREVEEIRSDISSDIMELKKEKERKRNQEKLQEKFGIPGFGVGELGEEELMAYARILSEEAFEKEKANLADGGNGKIHRDAVDSFTSMHNEENAVLAADLTASTLEVHQNMVKEQVVPMASLSVYGNEKEEEMGEMDPELAEAIRCSLLDTTPGAGVSFRYSYDDGSNSTTPSGTSAVVPLSDTQTEPGKYTNPIGMEELTPPGSSWGGMAPTVSTKTRISNWGPAKSRAYVNEWPSPRQAALMPGEKWNEDGIFSYSKECFTKCEDGIEVDEDLELAIRLSLTEEEGRRLASSSRGDGV